MRLQILMTTPVGEFSGYTSESHESHETILLAIEQLQRECNNFTFLVLFNDGNRVCFPGDLIKRSVLRFIIKK